MEFLQVIDNNPSLKWQIIGWKPEFSTTLSSFCKVSVTIATAPPEPSPAQAFALFNWAIELPEVPNTMQWWTFVDIHWLVQTLLDGSDVKSFIPFSMMYTCFFRKKLLKTDVNLV